MLPTAIGRATDFPCDETVRNRYNFSQEKVLAEKHVQFYQTRKHKPVPLRLAGKQEAVSTNQMGYPQRAFALYLLMAQA